MNMGYSAVAAAGYTASNQPNPDHFRRATMILAQRNQLLRSTSWLTCPLYSMATLLTLLHSFPQLRPLAKYDGYFKLPTRLSTHSNHSLTVLFRPAQR